MEQDRQHSQNLLASQCLNEAWLRVIAFASARHSTRSPGEPWNTPQQRSILYFLPFPLFAASALLPTHAAFALSTCWTLLQSLPLFCHSG